MKPIKLYTLMAFALPAFLLLTTDVHACLPAPNINQSSPSCNTNVQLAAYSSDGSDGNYLYYLYNSGNVKISQNAGGIFTVAIGSPTVYYISIYDQDNHCESAKKSITATPGSAPLLGAYGYACTPTTASVFMSGTSGGTFSLLLYNGSYTMLASNTSGNFTISNYSTSNQYYAKIAVGSCTNQIALSIPLDVVVPTVGSTTTSACNGQSVTFTASGASNGAYRWYSDAGLTQLVSTNASVPFTATRTTTYYAINYGEYCTSTAASITVNVYTPVVPQINSASGFSSVFLSVISPPASTTYNWYGTASGGTALYTGTGNSFSATGTYYVSAILNQGTVTCESVRTAATGTIVSPPTVTQQGSLSSMTDVTLSTTSSYSTYQWTKEGTNINGATGSTYIATVAGNYGVVVTSSGVQGQGTSANTFVVYHVAPPSVSQSSLNCRTVNLQAYTSDGSEGSYTYKLFNSGQSLITQNTAGIFPAISTPATYFVSIYDSYNNYETPKTSFTATPAIAPALSAYGYSCTVGTAVVFMSGSAGGTYSLQLYDGVSYATVASNTSGNFTISNYSTSNQYYAKIAVGSCTNQIALSIPLDVVVPTVGSTTTSACNGQSVTFTASGASNGAYRWYSDAGLTQLVSTNASVPFTATRTTTYYAINYGEYCTSTAASITVNVYTPVVPQINSASGFSSVFLSVISPPASTTYNWYGTASGGTALYTGTGNSFSATGTYYVSAILNQGTVTCESVRTAATGTIVSPPTVTQQGSLTVLTTVTLGTTLAYNSYQWVKDGVDINEATASSYIVSATGHYKVLVGNNGVQGQGVSLETFVKFLVAQPSVQVRPSCTNTVTVQGYTSDGTDGNYTYYLYNSSLTKIDQNSGGLFSVTVYSPTVYWMSIYDNDNIYESTKTSFTVRPGVAPTLSDYAYSCTPGTAIAFMSGSASTTFNLLQYDGFGYVTLNSNTSGNFNFNFNTSYQYYAEAVLHGCSTRKLVIITLDNVTTPVVTGLTQICSGQLSGLQATASNNDFLWYDDFLLTHQVGSGSSFTPSNTQTTTQYVINIGEYCKSAPAVITTNVYTPVAPQLNSASGFGQVALSVISPLANTTYNWYNTASGGTALFNGASNSFSSSCIYYVSSVLSAGSITCESGRTMVTGTIVPTPVLMPHGSLNMGNHVTIAVTLPYDTYQWLTNGANINGATANSISVSAPGQYQVLVTKSGVQGQSISDIASIDYGVSSNENYVITNTVMTDNIYISTDIFALLANGLIQTVDYFDGLGRPMQTVSTQASPSQNDIVQPIIYDSFGRESIKYLPFTTTDQDGTYKTDAVGQANNNYNGSRQYDFYQGTNRVTTDTRPYAETIFEPSPLNRPQQDFGPGQNWKDSNKYVGHSYEINHDNDVLLFTYDLSTGLVSTGSGGQVKYYDSLQLYTNRTTDEHQNDVIEYVDKLGHTVCKKVQYSSDATGKLYASTYYIYDDFGNLVVVLPPEAIKSVLSTLPSQN